jgi:hypothetical protein
MVTLSVFKKGGSAFMLIKPGFIDKAKAVEPDQGTVFEFNILFARSREDVGDPGSDCILNLLLINIDDVADLFHHGNGFKDIVIGTADRFVFIGHDRNPGCYLTLAGVLYITVSTDRVEIKIKTRENVYKPVSG